MSTAVWARMLPAAAFESTIMAAPVVVIHQQRVDTWLTIYAYPGAGSIHGLDIFTHH